MQFASKPLDLVLGAGGVKGFGHIGVLKAIKALGVPIGTVTGVSVGSLVAALHTNGLDCEALFDQMLAGLKNRDNPLAMLETMTLSDPISLMIGGPVDLSVPMRRLVKDLELSPRDDLRIVACDYFAKVPVPFQGQDYDLATALTASCALPTVLRPVWHRDPKTGAMRLLVDGAVYHYNPTDFSEAPAIVVSFRPATSWPSGYRFKNPMDAYFHMREMYYPIAGHRRHVDAQKHILLEIGLKDVAGLNYGIDEQVCRAMVEDGYRTAMDRLSKLSPA